MPTFPPGAVSYWSFDTGFQDQVGTNHLTNVNGVTSVAGKLGPAADFESTSSQYLSCPSNASLQLGDSDFTIAVWFKCESLLSHNIVSKDSPSGREFTLVAANNNKVTFGIPGLLSVPSATDISIGPWYFCVVWHDAASDLFGLQIDNGSIQTAPSGVAVPITTSEFQIGARAYPGFEDYMDGLIDDVGLWRRVLTAQERTDLWNGGAGLAYAPVGVAPSITTQPVGSTVASGGSVTLTVVAEGTPPLAYQWTKAGVDILGATSASYDTGPVTATATYAVKVANAYGTVTSTTVTVTVGVAPTITTPPAGGTIAPGATFTLTVVATGTAPLTYQWRTAATDIPGATSPSFTTAPLLITASYTVRVTNAYGAVISAPATVVVAVPGQPQPVINATEVEKALIGKLAADAELAAALPDGIYYDLAPIGSTRFAIVSLSSSRGLYELNDAESLRTLIYVVKAVVLGTSSANVAAADKRIQELIDRQPLTLPAAAGATLMVARWVDRIRYTETANNDTWQHRGARYELTVTPA